MQNSAKEKNLTKSIDNLDTNIKNINKNVIPDKEDFNSRIQTVEQFRALFNGNIASELHCKNPYFKANSYINEKDICVYIFVLKK